MNKKLPRIKNYNPRVKIIEKKLGIPGDYQFHALRSSNFLQSNWHKNKLATINKLIKFDPEMTVLDLGTGSGNFEIYNHDKVKRIYGVDYNNLALEFLSSYLDKLRIKNITLIQSDIRDIRKLKIPKCDCVVLIDVIEHLRIKDVDKLIGEFKNLLKPGGMVCIITPNYNSPWSIMEYLFDHALTSLLPRFGECQHLSKFNPDNLKSIFEKHGYRTKKIQTFNLFSWMLPGQASTGLLKMELGSGMKFGNLLAGVFVKY